MEADGKKEENRGENRGEKKEDQNVECVVDQQQKRS